MVVLHHYAGTSRVNKPDNVIWGRPVSEIMPTIFRFASFGWIGVEIFFVISGFVICMSCWGRAPKDFFVSRVIRLYPAYWVAVAFTVTAITVLPGVWKRPHGPDILFNLTMLQSGSGVRNVDLVYWTLWSELRFYLLFMLVVAMGLTYRRIVVFCCVWVRRRCSRPSPSSPADPGRRPQRRLVLHRRARPLPHAPLRPGPAVVGHPRPDLADGPTGAGAPRLVRGRLQLARIPADLHGVPARHGRGRARLHGPRPLEVAGHGGLSDVPALPDALPRRYGADRPPARQDGPRLLVALTIAGFLVLSWLIHRLVERPLARMMKSGLESSFSRLRSFGRVG
ncbi:acyltransferase family protein [Streptomyces sp. M19]